MNFTIDESIMMNRVLYILGCFECVLLKAMILPVSEF